MTRDARWTAALAATAWIAMLSGCSNPDKDWEIAQRDNTPEAYLEFLAKHPDSDYVDAAKQRVEEVRVVRAWERAEFRANEVAYRDFIERFPDSEQVELAQQRLREIERDAAWKAALAAESREVLEAFVRDYPDAPQLTEADDLLAELFAEQEPEPPAEPSGDYRVQLAAFRTAEAAESEVRRLARLFGNTIGGPIRIEAPVPGGNTRLFKLKTVPMTLSEASQTCDALKNFGQTCMVIER